MFRTTLIAIAVLFCLSVPAKALDFGFAFGHEDTNFGFYYGQPAYTFVPPLYAAPVIPVVSEPIYVDPEPVYVYPAPITYSYPVYVYAPPIYREYYYPPFYHHPLFAHHPYFWHEGYRHFYNCANSYTRRGNVFERHDFGRNSFFTPGRRDNNFGRDNHGRSDNRPNFQPERRGSEGGMRPSPPNQNHSPNQHYLPNSGTNQSKSQEQFKSQSGGLKIGPPRETIRTPGSPKIEWNRMNTRIQPKQSTGQMNKPSFSSGPKMSYTRPNMSSPKSGFSRPSMSSPRTGFSRPSTGNKGFSSSGGSTKRR